MPNNSAQFSHDSAFIWRLRGLTDDSVATNPKRTFMKTRLLLISWLFLVAAAAVGLARIVAAEAMDGNDRVDGQCDPVFLVLEFFDGVTPPALPIWVVEHDVGDI